MDPDSLRLEEEQLRRSWDRHPAEALDSYLVSGVQDPRINAQSILTRALLIDSLYPSRFTALIDEEFRFGLVLNWIRSELEKNRSRCQLLDDIRGAGPGAVPDAICGAYRWLQSDDCPLPDYITMTLESSNPDNPAESLSPVALETFMNMWQSALPPGPQPQPSVLEVACGSANDYRFLCASGLADRIAYMGIDISAKNIANAMQRHPRGAFLERSILSSGFDNSAYDVVFVHDLLEHLSEAAMDLALKEIARIARREAWLHFFRAKPGGPHDIVPAAEYHWNTVSMERIVATLRGHGMRADSLFLSEWHNSKFGFAGDCNPMAATVIAVKEG